MLYNPPIGGAANDPYVDANPGLGIDGSPVPAAAIEYPQRELLAVIQAAGLAPSNATLNQLLLALRSAGVFTTPAQFDTSTKAATMAAVQRALGSFAGFSGVSANRNLTVADIGCTVWFTGAYTLTLPTPASLGLPPGAAFTVYATGPSGTVAIGAGATLDTQAGPISIERGSSMTFFATSGTQWAAFGTSALGQLATQFGSSLGGSGWKKIPDPNSPTGYKIYQWGSIAKTTTTSPLAVTFPLAFPNNCFVVVPGIGGAVNPNGGPVSAGAVTAAGFQAYTTSGQAGQYVNWLAVGN